MKIEEFAPISPTRLKRMRWRGEQTYRILSQRFSVRWSGDLTADRVHYVFGGFAVSGPKGADRNSTDRDGAGVYSLVDLGPREPRRYRLVLAGKQLISSRNEDDVVNFLLYHILARVREQDAEFLLIHAGSVATPRGEGVLLPAASGFGKTTLVTGLIRAGFGFLSDEIGVIDHRTGMLRPYPRALNFKEGAVAIFPDLPSPGSAAPFERSYGYLRAEEIRPDVMVNACEVRFVITPRYQDGAATMVTPLSPAATVRELWTNAINVQTYGARALPILAEIARRTRGYRLVSRDLGEAVRAVADLTRGS